MNDFWNLDMSAAPRDGTLIFLTTGTASGCGRWAAIASRDTLNDIGYGDAAQAVFVREYGWRSAADKRITGSDPVAWAHIPALPALAARSTAIEGGE